MRRETMWRSRFGSPHVGKYLLISNPSAWYNTSMKVNKPIASPAGTVREGGATIADRFKLDTIESAKPARTTGKTAAAVALAAAVVGLALAGGLVFVLYGHLEFLSSI